MSEQGRVDVLKEQSIADLLKQLSTDTSTLVRQELELARAEMQEKGKQAGVGAGMLSGAAVAGLMTLGALTAAVIALLDRAMVTWLAALIVTLLWGAVAAVLGLQGKERLAHTSPVPEQTIETTKEDVAWAKTRARSGRK